MPLERIEHEQNAICPTTNGTNARLGGLTLVFTARRLHHHAMCCSLSEEGQGRTALRFFAFAQRVAEARDD
jgi:hypothetical protein